MLSQPPDRAARTPDRVVTVAAPAAMFAMLLAGAAHLTFADPDMYHEMALIREAVQLGHVPRADSFAYTPTISPVVHHEWGTGAVLYCLAHYFGATGILATRYLVITLLALVVVRCARAAAVSWGILCALAPVAIFMAWSGTSTIRAQLFSMLFFAILLNFLRADERGERWWIAPWLALYIIWLNVHGGFLAGAAIFAGHMVESVLRGRPIKHLLLIAAVMVALVAVNPYGASYYSYLLRAVVMDRPLITEWGPVWRGPPLAVTVFLISILVVAYAVYRGGWRRAPGILIVLLAALAATRHQRHTTLYAVAWMCYVPAFVQSTPLGDWLSRVWAQQGRRAAIPWLALAMLLTASFVRARPWHLLVPANAEDRRPPGMPLYPVGAVGYLRDHQFRGNLMTPFEVGAFVTWRLYPDVKVSLDGRYELVYLPDTLKEHNVFYTAKPGWEDVVRKYATDAILVPAESPVSHELRAGGEWQLRYRDDAYEVFARPDLALPAADRRGMAFTGEFP